MFGLLLVYTLTLEFIREEVKTVFFKRQGSLYMNPYIWDMKIYQTNLFAWVKGTNRLEIV